MRKLIIGFLNKVMNQVDFLQFLDFAAILKLSMCNKKFRRFLDPLHMNSVGRRNPRLARVAAIHLLPNPLDLTIRQIERKFGLAIRKISDFGRLDGEIAKDQMLRVLDSQPDTQKF